MDRLKLANQSIASGVLVGLGVVINTQSENKYIGAMLFSLALLVIIECDLKLYTGRIGFISSLSELKQLSYMFVFNLVGVILPMCLYSNREGFIENLTALSQNKFSSGYLDIFGRAVLCGVLMYIAVRCKNKLITVFSIMTFILSGYEHCIADYPYLVVNFSLENLYKFLLVVFGNTIGSIYMKTITDEKRSFNNEKSCKI